MNRINVLNQLGRNTPNKSEIDYKLIKKNQRMISIHKQIKISQMQLICRKRKIFLEQISFWRIKTINIAE